MKTTTLARNGVSAQTVELISRLVESIPWPARRRAMGDVTASLLDGKPRVAESVFGWSRRSVEVGMHETRGGLCCVSDLSARVKPRTQLALGTITRSKNWRRRLSDRICTNLTEEPTRCIPVASFCGHLSRPHQRILTDCFSSAWNGWAA